MSKFYTYDAWVDTFKPIWNDEPNGIMHFETYGDEWEKVKEAHAINPNTIWTEVDGDEGTYIIAGLAWVNRIHYYITAEPFTDEWTEVPTWCYRQCDCRTEENDYEYDPECTECEEGDINIPCETVEDLKQIYGEDNDDIIA